MGFSMQSQFGAIERKVEMLISRKSNPDKTDYQRGASVDMDHSSSSNLNPIIGYDQTNLVLLYRPQLLADKAWCSNAENPVLTINLAKYIKPISVSYEHAHWEGIVQNGAPRTYDVVASLDFYCEKWKPLVSNCEYSQYGSNEQMCNISSRIDVPLIGKVQFRSRENYGGTKMTCVHLVRVYGETKTPAKIEEKNLRSEEIYTDLRWYYHNSYFKYIWVFKLQSQVHKLEKKSEHKNHRFENSEDIKPSISDVILGSKIQGQTKPPVPINLKDPMISNEEFQFNAADFLNGASVDNDHSSSSNLNPIIGYDQTNLVLLDRPQPPTDKAWCSNAENPVLTIYLAKYIKPISVSYQHSKWHGTIPNGAPKTYDVVACLDYNCEKLERLVSNCEYKSYGAGAQEQVCNINPHQNVSSIGKVQFRFRENYGNTEMTCVHLVRVYGETKTPVKSKEKNLKSEEICSNLKLFIFYNEAKDIRLKMEKEPNPQEVELSETEPLTSNAPTTSYTEVEETEKPETTPSDKPPRRPGVW
ncbi:Protein CBG17734 [Caenorhabditis briggsae]|uniref:Protein CBG17734 n=1 Tax=Caenorhabditis briggsae TaxID=6238 RepID=A8XRE8_CAEBR|nr:Protein CBG17734 [Caenorhabditis briggsae]CAP35222.1 Protein CBG17734 [Caenorhabditis briggsae]